MPHFSFLPLTRIARHSATVAGLAILLSAPLSAAQASSESVIYTFGSSPFVDALEPLSGLTLSQGLFYGTSGLSGPYGSGSGVVYSVSPAGAETIVYNFGGNGDGGLPAADLLAMSGTLYGTTRAGGSATVCGSLGCGVAFMLTPAGKETALHAFQGGSDGAIPMAGLINVGTVLYGTTAYGGGGACMAPSGAYYAKTKGCGTIFKLTASGVKSVLHAFTGGKDGSLPTGDLINVGGTLYGTTQTGGGTVCGGAGCGTAFKITTGGVLTMLHAFTGGSDGANPQAALHLVGSTLYGTTSAGGGSCGCGSVFQIASGGVESVLHGFAGTDGSQPAGALISIGNVLYGTTAGGGSKGDGTVFSMTLAGKETVLHAFTGGNDGAQPLAGLTASGNVLYGTTVAGGSDNFGVVFKVSP